MACDIEITLGGKTYIKHSDEEVDAFIAEHLSQLSDEMKNGFAKIYSLNSLEETKSKLAKARKDFDEKTGVDKNTVSAGVTTLYTFLFPEKEAWKKSDELDEKFPGKYINPKDVGTEADNIFNSVFGEKLKPAKRLGKYREYLQESWIKEVLPQLKSQGLKVSNWKEQCFNQVGLQTRTWNEDLVKWLVEHDREFEDSLTKQKKMAKEISLIRGIADLLIIDDDGVLHIVDFKTAENVGKDPAQFIAKHQTYVAQVQTYAAILKQYGITVGESFLAVYETTYRDEEGSDPNEMKHVQLTDITFNNVMRVPHSGYAADLVTKFFWSAPEAKENTIENMSDILNESFPNTSITERLQAKELDYAFMVEHGIHPILESSDPTHYRQGYRFYFTKSRRLSNTKRAERVYGKTKAELTVDQVQPDGKLKVSPYRQYVNELNAYKAHRFKHFAEDLQHAMSIHSIDDFEATIEAIAPSNTATLKHHFKRYILGGWKFKANDTYNSNGIYLFEKGDRLEVIIIDDEHPINRYFKFNDNTSILGSYIPDSNLTDNRTIMQASYGNMMLMKACALLAMEPELTKNTRVTNIKALSFKSPRVFEENNSRLITNWNLLAELYDRNHPEKPKTRKLGSLTFEDDAKSAMEIADEYLEFLFIDAVKPNEKSNYRTLIRDRQNDKDFTRESLINLMHRLQWLNPETLRDFRNSNPYNTNAEIAHAYINKALLALEKINIFQENDLGSVIRGLNLAGINMRSFNESKSALARQMGDLIMRFNTGVRLEFVKEQYTWSKLIDAAYKAEGHVSKVIGNDWDFFKSWFEQTPDGKITEAFRLVKPENFSQGPEARKAYEYFLETNAKYRWTDPTEREEMRGTDKWYEVPLMAAGFTEQLTSGEPIAAIRHSWDKFKNQSIDVILGGKETNVIEQTRRELNKIDVDSLTNIINKSDLDRTNFIETNGINYLEKNLDLVMLNVLFSGIREERSPMFCELFTAMLISTDYLMSTSGLDVEEIRAAMEKFIASKFFLRDIRKPEEAALNGILGILKSITANVALGWNTRAFFREILTGQKKHFNRWLANAENHNAFVKGTKKFFSEPDFLNYGDFVEAYTDVVAKIFDNMSIFGFYSQLNAIYGMVEFSGREMIDSSKRHQWTVLGIPSKSSVTSTAPDFLHRMAILGGHLKTIGAWDAYSKNSEGRLVYDMKKDGQYQTWLKYKDDEKIIPQEEKNKFRAEKQHYQEALESWNQSGYDFHYGDFLPQALSPMETMRIKTFADTQYGNYDDETKSLIQKQTLGSLFFQYKTYGLAQFQLWFSNPTWTNELTYKNVLDENGEKLVAVPTTTIEQRQIHGDWEWLPESKVTDEMWQLHGTHYVKVLGGNYFIGKAQSSWILATHLFTLSGDEFRELWNSNPQYQKNLYISMLDLFEFAIIALLLRLFWGTDETPIYHQDFISRWTYGVLQGASTDGPLFQTIDGIFGDGTPPVFGMVKNYYHTFMSIINGNESLLYGLTNTFGMTRELSNAFRSTIK